ncbi:MAG TPA: RsmB/NOP family class I SAM-dependent RNA methyltransferase [Candidatus Saccharibacteria bacterium]|nr:RsmB/NOP family class I SAM-dependent RNA methyltransferase [Candidatus Saccharibacteria bacterium]
MSRKTELQAIERLAKKRQQWLERTALALNIAQDDAAILLTTQRQPSFRINDLKVRSKQQGKEVLKTLLGGGWQGEALGPGFTIDSGYEAVRDSHVVTEGLVYIQNAASWLPVVVLDPQPGEAILDVCAAPGGKASHIAAITQNQAELWLNDNSRIRLHKLRANLERLGVRVAGLTLYDATQLVRKYAQEQPRVFDKILLDAPCSGEGLMRLNNDKDFATWSVAHIKRLQQLQKKLITQAWQLLKPGGTLVYSTCTMAPEENEAVIDYLLRKNNDVQVKSIDIKLPNQVKSVLIWHGKEFDQSLHKSLRLAPSPHIEAFYVCSLLKLR